MAQFPALPLWTDAYLGDTTHLTTLEHGAYLLLLMAAWRTPDCSLPDDDRLLARYSKLTGGQWQRIRPIISQFWRIENGRWRQGRLTDEANLVRQRSASASDSARARWLKNNNPSDAVAMRSGCVGNATTPTSTPTVKREANASPKVRGFRLPDDWEPDDDKFPDALADRIRELVPEADRAAWVSDQVASFRDYWAARSGAGACKLDWDKTLHTWLRKELNDVRRRNWARSDATAARVISLHGPRR